MAMRPYLPEYLNQPEPPRKTMTTIFKRYAEGGTSDRRINLPQNSAIGASILQACAFHLPKPALLGDLPGA